MCRESEPCEDLGGRCSREKNTDQVRKDQGVKMGVDCREKVGLSRSIREGSPSEGEI